ncbi:hypothetical protein QX776_05890 [Alteromonadaceae bacterium BrNp21-10]|nr:hypothetical protein [Alteromonadaceae bacterium BrNp21-10]
MTRLMFLKFGITWFSLCFSMCCVGQIGNADRNIIVVANIDVAGIVLSKQQVKSLFMGSSVGYNFDVATLPPSSLVRVNFNTLIIGLTEDRIQSFWAQMRFTGRKTQPKQITSVESLLEYVKSTPGAVTYLPASITLPDNLKILYTTVSL